MTHARAVLVSLSLLGAFALAARADQVAIAPTMDKATPPERIEHPQVVIPKKSASTPGDHQGGRGATNVGWFYDGAPHAGLDAVRITMSPRALTTPDTNAIYWAFDSVFMDNQTYYLGLQPDGEFGKTALFSVFGPGSLPKSPACKSGADGGQGTHCHIHYPWQLGQSYEFTVALVAADAQWTTWEGAVVDLASGERTLVGDIAVPASRGYLKSWGTTFCEYFHRTTSCDEQPRSEVLFFRPYGYRDGREFPGKLHSLNANSGCNPSFSTDGDSYVFVDVGSKQ